MKKLLILTTLILGANAVEAQPINVTIEPASRHQTIEYFGAADAWSGNFVGKYWSEVVRQKIADLLFSQEYDENGNPKGAGLSAWRVNLGGGSLEAPNADIVPYHRRAESYLTIDGKGYDWGKCAGHEYWMGEAVKRGSNHFILFSNTPLVQYTLNGKGYSDDGMRANIREECYDDFARYLVDVTAHYMDKGWNIPFISPINEPQHKWDTPKQEGTMWRNSEVKRMMEALDKELSRDSRFDKVRIQLGETSRIKHLYRPNEKYAKIWGEMEAPHCVVRNFFDSASPHYVGHLRHLDREIYAHDYHELETNKLLREVRHAASEECSKYGVEFHASEWCLLPKTNGVQGFTDDWYSHNRADMQAGLLMARLIHSDMVDLATKSWSYWKGMELRGDHALISLHAKDGDIHSGGNAEANKLLYALGNYSFFIRPGYSRVELSGADDLDTVAATAYLAPDGKRLVVVYVNCSFEQRDICVTLPLKVRKQIASAAMYVTSERHDLTRREVVNALGYRLDARAITTVVYDLK